MEFIFKLGFYPCSNMNIFLKINVLSLIAPSRGAMAITTDRAAVDICQGPGNDLGDLPS